MQKKILSAVVIVAALVVAGWNYQQSQNSAPMSDLTLENIEALASGEGSGQYQACKGTEYVWGALKRTRNSSGRCEFKNLINVTLDGYCY